MSATPLDHLWIHGLHDVPACHLARHALISMNTCAASATSRTSHMQTIVKGVENSHNNISAQLGLSARPTYTTC